MNSLTPFSYRFEYSLTENDVEFFLIFDSKLPIYKTIHILLATLLIILLYFVFAKNISEFFVMVIFISIFIIILHPISTKQDVKKVIQYQIKKRPYQYLINETQEVILNQHGIENKSKYKEIVLSWDEIKHVLSDTNNIYFYLNFRSIIMIPRRLFNSNDEYEEFIRKVREAHTAARRAPRQGG